MKNVRPARGEIYLYEQIFYSILFFSHLFPPGNIMS